MTKDELQKAVDDVITDCIRNDYAFGNYAHRVTEAVWPVLEAAEKERDDVAQQLVQSEQGKRKISKECESYRAAYNVWADKTEWVQQGFNEGTISAKYLGMHRADVMARLLDEVEKERDALLAKIEAMGKQESLDADSDVFRSAFEAALKAGNWPATRQGDGYRSPSTQIAWRIAFSTVNRLKLYLAHGAQPAPSVPDADELAHFIRRIDGAHDLGASALAEKIVDWLAAAPEAKP